MRILGTDDGGGTAEIADQIEQGIGDAHIRAFLGYLVGCMLNYAAGLRRPLQLCWDRRSDLTILQQICVEHQGNQEILLQVQPSLRGVSPVVSFNEVAIGGLSSLARLAGVVAGDVRFFLQEAWPSDMGQDGRTCPHRGLIPPVHSRIRKYDGSQPASYCTCGSWRPGLLDWQQRHGSDSWLLQSFYR